MRATPFVPHGGAAPRRPSGSPPGGWRQAGPALVTGLVLALAAACEPGTEAERAARRPDVDSLASVVHRAGTEEGAGTTSGAAASTPDGEIMPRDPLVFTLDAPTRVAAGARVPITLRLTNMAADTVEAHFLGRDIAFDIVVRDEAGRVVWRRLEGMIVPQILHIRMLAPGESVVLRHTWEQHSNAGAPVRPGRYTLEGVLPSDAPEPRRTGPRTLTIEAS